MSAAAFTETSRAALCAAGFVVGVLKDLVLRVEGEGNQSVIQLGNLWLARRAGSPEDQLLERLVATVRARQGPRSTDSTTGARLFPLLRRTDQLSAIFSTLSSAERPPLWPLPADLWWTLASDRGDSIALATRWELDRLGLSDEAARSLALQNIGLLPLHLEPLHGAWQRLKAGGVWDAALLLRPDLWPQPSVSFVATPARDLLLLSRAPLPESALALLQLRAEWEGRLLHPLDWTARAVATIQATTGVLPR